MAKAGIDSFLLDCHTNDNMAEIEAAYGIKGFAVIVKLWQKIYSDKGYYCEWNERSPLLFLAQWFGGNSGADLNLIIEVVNHAIKIGIFNESMFNKYAVLTSERIQKQYFEVVKRRTEIKVINEYLLVSVGKNAVIVNINGENVCRNQKNVCRNSTSKVKESKVKESKDNREVANYFQNTKLNQAFLDYLSYKEEKSGPVSGIQISYILQELEQLLYRDRLPKFRNIGADGKHHMVFNWFEWGRDGKEIPKIHPAQKPIGLLKKLIETLTDEGDVVIDPCAGSGATLRASRELKRNSYGFEIDKNFYKKASEEMLVFEDDNQMTIEDLMENNNGTNNDGI